MQTYPSCENLINLIRSKPSYQKYYEDIENWEIFDNYASFTNFPEFKTLLKGYKFDDNLVYFIHSNNFKLIHFTYDYDPKTGEYDNKKYSILQTFSTPEQVWQELIKPDIEEYYGIVIEE